MFRDYLIQTSQFGADPIKKFEPKIYTTLILEHSYWLKFLATNENG